MRRNFQLAIVLLFLVILEISTIMYNGTTTLQNIVHSVSSRKIQPKHAQKFKPPIRPKVKAAEHLNDRKHQKKQRFAKFAKQVKKDSSKTFNNRKESIPNAGSNQVLQTISRKRIEKNFTRLVMALPNYQNTRRESESQGQDPARNMSLSNNRVYSNIKFSPTLQKQHATTLRNGSGKTRSTLERSGVRVIIAAHGRSGSSFFGGIFNAHPDFFFVYEPLYQLKNIVHRDTDQYIERVEYIINAIFNCDFEDNRFLEIMSHADFHRASSRPLVSPPFCNTDYEKGINFVVNQNWKLCNRKISANALNRICHKHANIASKILLERIEPVNLSSFFSISGAPPSSSEIRSFVPVSEGPGKEVKPVYVLYLVRDPRAMMYSRHRLGWIVRRERNEYAFESGEVDENVKKVCDMIEMNLGAVLRHPSHIKLVRYEELVTKPEDVVRHLFEELHISPSKEVFRWIYSKTHGPVDLSALSLSRNANASINYWRKKIPRKLLGIIETRCARVMKYLGYLSSNGSPEVLHDLRTPLHLHKIGDLKENFGFPAM